MAQERRNIKEKSETPYARIFISMFLFSAILTLNFQKLFLLVAAIFGFILILVLVSLSFVGDERESQYWVPHLLTAV